jgi:hypothetical protein
MLGNLAVVFQLGGKESIVAKPQALRVLPRANFCSHATDIQSLGRGATSKCSFAEEEHAEVFRKEFGGD